MKAISVCVLFLALSINSFAQNVDIPDPNFKAYLLSNSYINTDVDESVGEISVAEASAYFGGINVNEKGISNLKGIEAFTQIIYLACGSNNLTSLDLSANSNLTQLWCYENQLTTLDLSANTVLTYLVCFSNKLDSLDVSTNVALTDISCSNNLLTMLDVSANIALMSLDCRTNRLTNLDLSSNTNLTNLSCTGNQLTSLNLSANIALTNLDCTDNQLTSLDLSANTALTSIRCDKNKLTSLNVSANKALTSLNCKDNLLASLNISDNKELMDLVCYSNNLTSLDLSANIALVYLDCKSNRLTDLDLSANNNLQFLDCDLNQLTSLNLKNGNNVNVYFFSSLSNPKLNCIEVDDPVYAKANWVNIDTEASFSSLCGSSDIMITNEIANNSSFRKPYILWKGISSQSVPTIKICADGSSATKIYFKNNTGKNSSDIRFQLESDPNSTDLDLYGYFNIPRVSENDVYAEFFHPEYLSSNYTPSRKDAILIVDVNALETPIMRIPIEVYRAPFLMVHGLWADEKTFETLNYELVRSGLYPYEITKRTDYSGTNSVRFLTNRGIVPEGINICLTQCRMYDYSAGKVDVIGHSMGGILSRIYLQSLYYKYDVHLLITLNTPHSGSQGANLLKQIDSDFIRTVLKYNDFPTEYGAIDDLQVNSDAIRTTLNGVNINNHIVPSHTIVTKSSFFDGVSWGSLIIKLAALKYGLPDPNDFLKELFNGEASDLVVAVSSQQGGLPNWACTNIPGSQIHTGSSDNIDVINKIKSLLCVNPNFEVPFSKDGFNPVELTSVYKKTLVSTSQQHSTGTITIINPIKNGTVNSGSVIPIEVTSTGTITRILYAASNNTSDLIFADSLSSKVTFYDTIPSNVLGVRKIIAMGFDSNGFVAMDTITINIITDAVLDSISIYGNAIYLEKNKTASVSVDGYFNNGNKYDISLLPDVQFHLNDINIAEYANLNLIQGRDTGTTVLSVSYQNKTKEIPIFVIPEDTTTMNDVTSLPETQKMKDPSAEGLINITVYPNPANDIIIVDFQDYSSGNNTILQLFSIDGVLLCTKSIQQKQTYLGIAEYPNGVYIVKLTDSKGIAVKRVIKE